MDEVEWINPIVIQTKKYLEDIIVCVDYKSLNSTSVHVSFPTPIMDEVLD